MKIIFDSVLSDIPFMNVRTKEVFVCTRGPQQGMVFMRIEPIFVGSLLLKNAVCLTNGRSVLISNFEPVAVREAILTVGGVQLTKA